MSAGAMTVDQRTAEQLREEGRQEERARIVAELAKHRDELCGEEWSIKRATWNFALIIARGKQPKMTGEVVEE